VQYRQKRDLVLLQQHVNRTCAAINLAGGHKRQYRIPFPKPAIDGHLEHGPAVAGAQPLAVYDAHARKTLLDRVIDEIGQPGPGLVDCHAVQVYFGLYGIFSPGQLAHCPGADVLPMKPHILGIRTLHRVDIVLKTLL